MLLRDLGKLPQPLQVQPLVSLAPGGLDGALLDLLLCGELLGQVDHRDTLCQRAFVQPLDGGAHQLLVALVDLGRVVGLRHQTPHALEGAVRPGRQGFRAGAGGGRYPRGRHLAEGVEDVLRGNVEAEAPQAVEVVVELFGRLGMPGGDGERPRGQHLSLFARLREISFDGLRLEALEQHRDPAQAPELLLADGFALGADIVASARDAMGARALPPGRGHRSPDAHGLPEDQVHLRRRNASGFAQGLQAGRENPTVVIRAIVEERVLQPGHEVLERLLRKEPEIAHHVNLLGAVVEVVGESDVLRALAEAPRVDRRRDQFGRVAQEQTERIRDDERRQEVGEVLLQFLERLTDLGAWSRVAHTGCWADLG